jgi:serine/threonine protein phosphatase PrpC
VDDKNPVSGALTQALNAMFQEYDPHYHHYRYNGKKERFIICSDGLIESLGEAVIKEQMFRPDDAGVIRREMTELAYTKRPQDNFTFIIIEIETNVNG